MKFILVIVLSQFLAGCQGILKTVYGTKKPAVQTAEGITHWLNREGLCPQNIASISPEAFVDIFIHFGEGLKIFTAEGHFLPIGYNTDGTFCPQDLTNILATLITFPGFAVPGAVYSSLFAGAPSGAQQAPRFNLQSLFAGLRTLQSAAIPFYPGNADYVLLIPFALSAGSRLQTKDMRSYVKALSQNPPSRFSIWYLNFGKQAWWGEEWIGTIVVQ